MTRRQFLLGATTTAMTAKSALTSTPRRRSIIAPPKISPGAHLRLIAPSGALEASANLDRAIESIERAGFKASVGDSVHRRFSYLAGTDEERAKDLMAAVRDPRVDGILCVRGGYGAARILPWLDYEAIRTHPKPLIGYSDITALHLAYLAKAGLQSFHGPVAISTWSEFSQGHLLDALAGKSFGWPDLGTPKVLKAGRGKGRLVGGNLAVFCSLYGTPYMPSLDGAILFFEDIGEEPYRIDRMLTTLLIGGVFKAAKGLIFGQFTDWQPKEVPREQTWTPDEVIADRVQNLKIPVVSNVKFGHVADKLTLTQGRMAVLDTKAQSLSLV